MTYIDLFFYIDLQMIWPLGEICQKVILLHKSKMGDKREGGIKRSLKMGDVIYGRPIVE